VHPKYRACELIQRSMGCRAREVYDLPQCEVYPLYRKSASGTSVVGGWGRYKQIIDLFVVEFEV
jgi:hypothetical protein